MPILTILLLLPLAGVALVAVLPSDKVRIIRWVALGVSAATLALAWGLIPFFNTGDAGLQFFEKIPWHPKLGSYYALGLDGFSFPLVLLATLLAFVALAVSTGIHKWVKGYYISMLLLETAMLGVFMAQDWSLFYVFWELVLLPVFFLINRWGGERRQHAALNFVLYTMGGSVFMLIGLLLAFDAAGIHSFSMPEMAAALAVVRPETQLVIFLGFLIGFGVKMPIFPMHGWLPPAYVEAPSPVSILLSGVLPKMGSYGLIRAATMLPDAMVTMQATLVTLAFVNLIYGGLLAWRQTDIKAMVAYSSISHMGIVLLGMATLNTAGVTGAVMQMVAHGLVVGSLFLLIGLLYQRTQTREIADYGALIRVAPRFALFISLAFVAAVGLPGTAGFIAELHIIVGSFQNWGWVAALVGVGMLISAAYSVRTVGRLFGGAVPAAMGSFADLKRLELLAACVLASAVIALGVAPAPALALVGASVEQFGQLFVGRF